MPTYQIKVPEVHYQTVEIDAPTEADAVRQVIDFEGDRVEGGLEYSHVIEEYLENLLDELESGETDVHDWMIYEVNND